MRAVLCNEPGTLAVVERDQPDHKDGHIRVRIRAVGICGTDYHIYGGNQPFVSYPRVMGHELSGHALDASSDGRIKPGDLVVVNPYLTCGVCRACRAGRPNCCENIAVLGVHTDGGMCDEISVPEGNLINGAGLSETAAAMVEFLAIGAHGVRRAQIPAGAKTLVIGAGPIGLGAALFAGIDGADVTLRDVSPARLELAQAAMPAARIETVDGAHADVYDTVIDATGNLKAMNGALDWLGHAGTLVLLSVVKGDLSFPDQEFHKRETTLLASRNALMADFEHVMACMRAGKVPIDALATHETPLEEAPAQLPVWAADRGSVIKAIIRV